MPSGAHQCDPHHIYLLHIQMLLTEYYTVITMEIKWNARVKLTKIIFANVDVTGDVNTDISWPG